MEKPLEAAWIGPQVRWGEVSGYHQGGAKRDRQEDGDLDMAPACQLCAAGL